MKIERNASMSKAVPSIRELTANEIRVVGGGAAASTGGGAASTSGGKKKKKKGGARAE